MVVMLDATQKFVELMLHWLLFVMPPSEVTRVDGRRRFRTFNHGFDNFTGLVIVRVRRLGYEERLGR